MQQQQPEQRRNEQMETQRVDPNVVRVWRWRAVLFLLLPCVPLTVLVVRGPAPASYLVPLVYLVIALILIWRWPPAYYRTLEFGLDAHGIAIRRGIFWRSRILLPRIRVQHSDVSQGPLERRYGVATLKLYTAGSHYTKVELPGLAHDDAIALREQLVARGGDAGV